MGARRRLAVELGCIFISVLMAAASPLAAQTAAPPPAEPTAPLVIAVDSPLDTLDPHLVFDTRRTAARLSLYDGLFRWQDSPVRLAPWLALSYTISEDGKVFRFSLNKEARFHDGREVKAADVVYSVERILALKRGVAPLLAGLVNPGSTKAIDATTVEFSLSRPSPLFLTLLSEILVVNSELLKANELNNDWGRAWLQRNAAGSGPYTLKSYDPLSGLVVARNAEHFSGEWGPKPIAEIEYRTMLDPEARVEGLIKGEIQAIDGDLLPHHVRRLREAKDIALSESQGARTFVGLLHNGREPMKALPFRQVLAQAFDADGFMRSTLPAGPVVTPLTVPLPPTLGLPNPMPPRPRYDLELAKANLAKLKLTPREMTIGAIAGDPQSERAAALMLESLTRLGLTARIIIEPWPAVAARMRDDKTMFDILFLWKGTRYLDANNWVGEMYDCDLFGGGNSSWYCNRDADKLIKEARAAADPKVRRAGFEKAAVKIAEDQASLFIASGRWTVAHAKRLKGIRFSPVGEALDLRFAAFE